MPRPATAKIPKKTHENAFCLPLQRPLPHHVHSPKPPCARLAAQPDTLLLDEPFSALDYQTRLAVCDDVHAIIKSERKTALLVTHDISEAIALSDRVIALSARPAAVVGEHDVTFGDGSPKSRRASGEFAAMFETLRGELGI